ncbi:MAG TPA: CPBP family intramembrane metalloprotease, partial [Candidatus Agathobaculum merdigallinarum]|nr:CPBP family intramembrane metalloprotease [Candidatus Agathobaculum merdigallinarum]
MTDKKVIVNFTALTFCIAYLVSGVLIVLGQFGYQVYIWVNTFPQFCANIPFAVYILSPAIASYIVLKRSHQVAGLREWLKTVFCVKNGIYPYLFVIAGLVLYFSLHAAFSGRTAIALPFYVFFLSLPG